MIRKACGRKVSGPEQKCSDGICLDGLREATKTSQSSSFLDRDLNHGSLEQKSGMLHTLPVCSVMCGEVHFLVTALYLRGNTRNLMLHTWQCAGVTNMKQARIFRREFVFLFLQTWHVTPFLCIRAEVTHVDAIFMRTPSEFCTREVEINRLQEYEFEAHRKCTLGGFVVQAVSEWFCRAGFSSRVM
jgi:hypothetical protein